MSDIVNVSNFELKINYRCPYNHRDATVTCNQTNLRSIIDDFSPTLYYTTLKCPQCGFSHQIRIVHLRNYGEGLV